MKKILIFLGLVVLIVLFAGIYRFNFTNDDIYIQNLDGEIVKIDELNNEYVPWEQAIEILNEGNIESVMQSHNLDVLLEFGNGTIIKTIEPKIDIIFDEVEKCGEKCKNIILITE